MSDAETVAWCHCSDCRKWTGSPMPAFAAFASEAVEISHDIAEFSIHEGVSRRNCPRCGSPLTARFSYLPGQTYIPVGLLDQAGTLPPEIHCHTDSALPWSPLHDDLPKTGKSARLTLRGNAT